MKRLFLTLLCLLIFCGIADARMLQGIAGSVTASCADTSCSGFLVCQNFEGTGYDNSETWAESCGSGATCDEDYTSSPLRGSQSYKFTTGTSGSSVYVNFTEQDEVYFHIKFSIDNDSGSDLIQIGAGATSLFLIGYSSGTNKLVYNSATLSSVTISTGTVYHLWGYYKKGTGSDEINRAWLSTTTTKPGLVDYEIINGTSTGQASRISLKDSGNATSATFDQVLVSTTSIGDVCD